MCATPARMSVMISDGGVGLANRLSSWVGWAEVVGVEESVGQARPRNTPKISRTSTG